MSCDGCEHLCRVFLCYNVVETNRQWTFPLTMTFTQHIGVMSEALLTKLPVTVVPKDPSVSTTVWRHRHHRHRPRGARPKTSSARASH